MNYDWRAMLVYVALFMFAPLLVAFVIGKIPRFAEIREINGRVDREKRGKDTYRTTLQRGQKVSTIFNFGFAILMIPFFINLESRPLWQDAVQFLAILLVYDFLYYWLHRVFFHGTLLRKEHSIHHQAQRPTVGDSAFIHPWEAFLGIFVFMVATPIIALVSGAPVHAVTAGLAAVAWAQLTQLNHAWTNLPKGSGLNRWVNYVTAVHRAHHVGMGGGNYATLTTIYDRLFGTFDEPLSRETV